MAVRRGFTLIELVVVVIIVGILAVVTIPYVMTSMEQTKAQAAKNNLLAIAIGQERYYEDNGSYSTSNLNSSLRLSLSSNDPFTYACSTVTAPYSCTAQDDAVTLTLTVDPATQANTVTCTTGGSYCPSSPS